MAYYFQIQYANIEQSYYKANLIGQDQVTIAKLRTEIRCVCKFAFSLLLQRLATTKHGFCDHLHDLVLNMFC